MIRRWVITIEDDCDHHGAIHDRYYCEWEYGSKKGFKIPLSIIVGVTLIDEPTNPAGGK